MMTEKQDVTQTVLSNLSLYLTENLRFDADFVVKLHASQLLDYANRGQLLFKLKEGKREEAVLGLLDYMRDFYDEEMLKKFCMALEDYAKPTKRALVNVVEKIKEELTRYVCDSLSHCIFL